ncbi:Ku protein [Streptomyces sp. NPDC090053]|uniref:non-homologous end joining protein Ku n=1 Tax=Streptomyces sp. NPDC090053 TaxID=3365932 RepID=UPI00382E7887
MPHPVWTGAISFGLVTVPCRVWPATENRSIALHQYHEADQGRVRNRKVCAIDGQVLSSAEIGRAYETAAGDLVEVTDDELDHMPLPTAQAIEVIGFVPASSIDPIRIGRGYYLEPSGKVAHKPYVLLRKALERSSRVAIAKFSMRDRERLGLLRVKDETILLHAMRWPDEIRSPESILPKEVELSDSEVDAAVQLMETMAADDLSGFHDRYREAMEELIEAKSQDRAPAVPETEADTSGGQLVDLMSALNASVSAARENRGEDAEVHDIKHAAKKTPGKKTATKKRTTKKTAAGKSKSA